MSNKRLAAALFYYFTKFHRVASGIPRMPCRAERVPLMLED